MTHVKVGQFPDIAALFAVPAGTTAGSGSSSRHGSKPVWMSSWASLPVEGVEGRC